MKKLFLIIISVLCVNVANAFDLKGLLGGNGSSDNSTVNGILNAAGSLIGGSDVSISELQGTWKYQSPAISFKSDNFLERAGGAAASSTIESKLKPLFDRAGVGNLTIEFKADSTFVAGNGRFNVQGTVTKGENGAFVFNVNALGKVKAASINAYVSKDITGVLSLTFDATKLMNVVSSIAGATGNSTLNAVSGILKSYEGMNIGGKFKKK